jgi:cytochrome c oxidase assembly protein subunit 11
VTIPHNPAQNTRTAILAGSIAVTMLGLAFAAVPLYRLFCQVTGFNGTTMRATVAPEKLLDRQVTVRFDANVAAGLPWRFEPEVRTMTVRLGETAMVNYRATNLSNATAMGNSTYNVVPEQAGAFFNKLQCFCFTDQPLAAGETILMPVQFFVDPAMARDKDGRRIETITLSYTFYPVTASKKGVAEPGTPVDKLPGRT